MDKNISQCFLVKLNYLKHNDLGTSQMHYHNIPLVCKDHYIYQHLQGYTINISRYHS